MCYVLSALFSVLVTIIYRRSKFRESSHYICFLLYHGTILSCGFRKLSIVPTSVISDFQKGRMHGPSSWPFPVYYVQNRFMMSFSLVSLHFTLFQLGGGRVIVYFDASLNFINLFGTLTLVHCSGVSFLAYRPTPNSMNYWPSLH